MITHQNWKPQEKVKQGAKVKENFYWELLQLLLLMIQIKGTDDTKIRMVGGIVSSEDKAAVQHNLYHSIKGVYSDKLLSCSQTQNHISRNKKNGMRNCIFCV